MPPQSGQIATSELADFAMLTSPASYYPHSNLDKPQSPPDTADVPLRDESFAPAGAMQLRAVTRGCFADEIAIDFPAMGTAIDRVRDTFVTHDEHLAAVSASVTLTPRQAFDGTIVPVEIAMPSLCRHCGGRGESWSDPCSGCRGTGESDQPHHVQLAVPARVADGTRFRFVVTSPWSRPTRVEVTVSVA